MRPTPFDVFREIYQALEPDAFRDSEGNPDLTEAELLLRRTLDTAVLQRLATAATQLAGMAAFAYGERVMLEARRRAGTFNSGDLVCGIQIGTGELISGRYAGDGHDGVAFVSLGLSSLLRVNRDSMRHIGDHGEPIDRPHAYEVTA